MAERPLPAYAGDGPYVFVTYSHEDTDLVYLQIRWLQDQGFKVSWDEGISPGTVWRGELAQAIRGCSLLLYFVTRNSVASDHCIREVNFALDEHHRPVLAVYMQETALPDVLALSLSDRQAIMQYSLDPADYERKLASTIAVYLDQPTPTISTSLGRPKKRVPQPSWLIVFGWSLVVGSVAVVGTWEMIEPTYPERAQKVQFSLRLPERVSLPLDSGQHVNIDSSGDYFFFVGQNDDGRRKVYVRRIDELKSKPVPGTDDTLDAVLESVTPSPDGKHLALGYNSGEVRRVPSSGGVPTLIADSRTRIINRVHWGPHNRIAMRYDNGVAIVEAASSGAELEELASVEDFWQISFPYYSPDRRSLFFARGEIDEYSVMVTPLSEFDPIQLIANASDPRVTSSGRLLFLRDGAVWAVALDESQRKVVGTPVVVLRGAKYTSIFHAQYAVSDNGTLVYQLATGSRDFDLISLDRTGRRTVLDTFQEPILMPRFSPDARHLAFTTGVEGTLSLYSLDSRLLTNLRDSSTEIWSPVWSPEGNKIAFTEMSSGVEEIYVEDLDGEESLRVMTNVGRGFRWPSEWTNDGKYLLSNECDSLNTGCGIRMWPTDPPGEGKMISGPSASERGASLSPDNDYLAYVSDASGFLRARARAFPNGRVHVEIPVDDCNIVRWSPVGDELFAFCDGQMLAIPLQTEPTLSIGEPVGLFSVNSIFYRAYNDRAAWFFDISPDGERFLMAAEREPESEVVVVLNWLDEVDLLTAAR